MIWTLFSILILVLILVDMGVFNKNNHIVSMKESLVWTLIWVVIALLFSFVVFYIYEDNWFDFNSQNLDSTKTVLDYITAYFLEKALSMDNVFVFAMIFGFFKIEPIFQHRVLFWGIVLAILLRILMIFFGITLVEKFSWSIYVFGAILIYSAINMLVSKDEEKDFTKNFFLIVVNKFYPIDWKTQTSKFIIIKDSRKFISISLAAFIIIAFTDIIFALDSIPAVLAVTKDPFIVVTSNVFAIMGLRNLYFFLIHIIYKFRLVKYSLVIILFFVGIKIILSPFYHVPVLISLSIILLFLTLGIVLSMMFVDNKSEKRVG